MTQVELGECQLQPPLLAGGQVIDWSGRRQGETAFPTSVGTEVGEGFHHLAFSCQNQGREPGRADSQKVSPKCPAHYESSLRARQQTPSAG